MSSLRNVRRSFARISIVFAALCFSACTLEKPTACLVETADFCVCCPPSDCRKESSFCPGGEAGLLLLKARDPACAVNPWDEGSCRSGILASERRSALGVNVQGQKARIDLSTVQLNALLEQLRRLAR